jgi:hypothetical protein
VMRKVLAWKSIVEDSRIQQQLTQGQATDARDKAKSNRESAEKAVRGAWSHFLYPIKSEVAGKPFELEQSLISSRDRNAIASGVYDKAKADGIVLEKLGIERLALALKPIWPDDRPHLSVSEIADWFASYVYLPKLRDGVVLETAIRDAVAKLDPQFGYADSVDEATGGYRKLIWAKNPPELISPGALLVREAEAKKQLSEEGLPLQTPQPESPGVSRPQPIKPGPVIPSNRPRRFYGSVEIDMVRPVKSFDAILNAVVMELQRTRGAKVKLTLELEAAADDGFADTEVGVVRDNARQLKFKPESTGFED